MPEQPIHKIAALAALAGASLLFAGTFLHPLGADPNDPLAAFTEYAADNLWVVSHLMQLFGVLLMVGALLLLSRIMTGGRGASWAYLGAVSAGVSLALAAALQAVDGIALKVMVDSWAAASPAEKGMLFYAAFGVRQIEVGLASIASLLMGLTAALYGLALLSDKDFPRWLGWLAILGGLPTALSGIVMAYTGFSNVAMSINMLASLVLLLWIIALGVWLWRTAPPKVQK